MPKLKRRSRDVHAGCSRMPYPCVGGTYPVRSWLPATVGAVCICIGRCMSSSCKVSAKPNPASQPCYETAVLRRSPCHVYALFEVALTSLLWPPTRRCFTADNRLQHSSTQPGLPTQLARSALAYALSLALALICPTKWPALGGALCIPESCQASALPHLHKSTHRGTSKLGAGSKQARK